MAVAAGSDYSGAAACQKCHPANFAEQSASAHASSLKRSSATQPGEWAFGAGVQAITFVKRQDPDHYLELGETWYRKIGGFALTPGHRNRSGVLYPIFDPSAAILRCFSCHSTGPLSFSPDESIVPHEPGVRCEACHGPGAAHVRNPRQIPMRDPGRLSAEDLNRLCGECHRMPAAAGDSTDLRNPWNARHQPLLLAVSRCFRESGGRLNCLTCHSPHAPLETRLSGYDSKCQNCHVQVAHKASIAGRACAGCHMPRVRPLANLAFANHRIAVYLPSGPMIPLSK